MREMHKDNTRMRRVLTLCLFIIIMVLYISIQLYWGFNLYKAFMNEEKKELDDLLSSVITSYAATTLSKNASNPDSPTLTLERVSTENDSVLTNAVVTGIVKEPEELSSTLEKVLIVASIRTDSLFIDRLAQSFKQKLSGRNIYSLDMELRVNNRLTAQSSSKVSEQAFSFYPIQIEIEKEFEVEGETYAITSTVRGEFPKSLRVLASLFIVGILLLVIILYLLITMTKRIERERALTHQQELFFYGLVHDLKLPLSLAHSLIDGLATNVDIPQQAQAGLIEADNHILKLTDDINLLLTMHRVKQNKKSESRQIYIYDMVQDIITEIEAHYPEKKVSFLSEIPDSLSILFPAEELKLILRVFIDNAVKYSQEDPKIKVCATGNTDAVSIKISDNGSGIKIFGEDKAYELNQSRIRQLCMDSNGGVGLMIAWTILNAKGGKITYERAMPMGSLFTLSIPFDKN